MTSELRTLQEQLLTPGREFALAEALDIVDDIYDNCEIDTNCRFHNVFYHEICPLLSIAKHLGPEATKIAFTGAKSRIDGAILLGPDQRWQSVELTAAIDGHNDALVMELLAKRGNAPAFQKIEATGSKQNRRFGDNELKAIDRAQYDQEELLPRLKLALVQKIDKSRCNEHYASAWLGIVFDDWIMPVNEKKKERFDPICRQLLGDDPAVYAPFSRVFCLGLSRMYLFDSLGT